MGGFETIRVGQTGACNNEHEKGTRAKTRNGTVALSLSAVVRCTRERKSPCRTLASPVLFYGKWRGAGHGLYRLILEEKQEKQTAQQRLNQKLQMVLNPFFKSIQVLCLGSMDNQGELLEEFFSCNL
jgi:hypothetical protein